MFDATCARLRLSRDALLKLHEQDLPLLRLAGVTFASWRLIEAWARATARR